MIIVVRGVNKYIWHTAILDILVSMGKMVASNATKCICHTLKTKALVVLIAIFLSEKAARTNWHVFVQGRIMLHKDIYKWIIKYSYMYYLILTEPLKNIWLSKSKLTNLVRINSHPVRTNIHPCVVSILMSMFRSLSCLRAFILF